jgi:hypothetical protein
MSLMSESEIKDCLLDLLSVISSKDFDWWLGRGLVRNYYLNHQIGNKQSDVDVHVWAKDKDRIIREIEKPLLRLGYALVEEPDRPYKFTFEDKKNKYIEFIMLYPVEGGYIHRRKEGPKGPHPKNCFSGYDVMNIEGLVLKVPKDLDQYLDTTYPKWKSNDKNRK